ncbi:MAG: hypothetical protein FH762_13895 [Firmicutes bacterium]|nr:hypothetical protein [Bacillota bacterium]
MKISFKRYFWFLSVFIVLLLLSSVTFAVSDYEEYVARLNLDGLYNEYRDNIYKLDGNDYFVKILDNLTSRLDTKLNFEIHYVDSDVVNAYYIGDGKVVLFRGLLDRLANSDQCAAVIAHEMGHGVNDHIDGQLKSVIGLGIGGWLLDQIAGKDSSDKTYNLLKKFGLTLIDNGYSRENEEEADLFSVKLLDKSGYNPSGAVQVMQILDRLNGSYNSELLELLQTHPNPQTRIEYMTKEIKKTTGKKPEYLSGEYLDIYFDD